MKHFDLLIILILVILFLTNISIFEKQRNERERDVGTTTATQAGYHELLRWTTWYVSLNCRRNGMDEGVIQESIWINKDGGSRTEGYKNIGGIVGWVWVCEVLLVGHSCSVVSSNHGCIAWGIKLAWWSNCHWKRSCFTVEIMRWRISLWRGNNAETNASLSMPK